MLAATATCHWPGWDVRLYLKRIVRYRLEEARLRPEIEGENENLSNSSIKITKVRMAMQKLPGVGSGESPDSLNSKVDVAQLLWSRLREDLSATSSQT